jgi:hypothetical protein
MKPQVRPFLLPLMAVFLFSFDRFSNSQVTNIFLADTNIAAGFTNYDGQSITVSGCTVTIAGQHSFANVLITNDGVITCASLNNLDQVSNQWVGVGVTIEAGSVTVAVGGTISADGQGYGPQAGPGEGGNPGGGGGYGGNGGSGYSGFGPYNNGGPTYGSLLLPTDLGSGGGNDQDYDGGSGGGAIKLTVAQTLVLDGIITSDGQSAGSGGGSGGSILILASNLTGSGSLQANGGASTGGDSGDGGGGRITVYYTNAASFTGFTNCAANGASAGTTLFLNQIGTNLGINLFANLNFNAGTSNHFGSVTLNGGATLTMGGGSLLQVDGELSVESNATVVCQGLNNLDEVSNQWVGVRSEHPGR